MRENLYMYLDKGRFRSFVCVCVCVCGLNDLSDAMDDRDR